MATVRQLLDEAVSNNGVPLQIVEKDYALSYLLAGIAKTKGLGEAITLKGGTALRKLYFKDYRFSEDLDYSSLSATPIPNVDAHMEDAVAATGELLNERGPFQTTWERMPLRDPHPGGQVAYYVRVQFPYHPRPMCRLKVEITVDEPILLPQVEKPILHTYNEEIDEAVTAYPLEEIIAEKLRALLQSLRRLRSKGWGASRVSRDYYDLWWVMKHAKVETSNIPGTTAKKCAARGLSFQLPDEFLHKDLLAVADEEWQQQLSPFVSQTPDLKTVISELRPSLIDIWNSREGIS